MRGKHHEAVQTPKARQKRGHVVTTAFGECYLRWLEECRNQAARAWEQGWASPTPRDRGQCWEKLLSFFRDHQRPEVEQALIDPYFPIRAMARTHLQARIPGRDPEQVQVERVVGVCRVFQRIRQDIRILSQRARVSPIPLEGDMRQGLPQDQWCSFCGDCCFLGGTVPDPPEGVTYPGYWYAYLAGDSPAIQEFCPFLFEFFALGRLFCAIHPIKPRTCQAYGREQCVRVHPGKARPGGGEARF